MNIRPVNIDTDYPTLVKWWEGHRALAMPKEVFPQGWCVEETGVEVAMLFLYLDVGGKFAVIEWLTTNPKVAYSRTLIACVVALNVHIQEVAKSQGCTFALSFVGENTGEERLLKKIGYQTSQGIGHKTYAKVL